MATTTAHHGPRLVVIRLAIVVYSLIRPSLAHAFTSNHTITALPMPCLPGQASALLRLKRSFISTDDSFLAFRSWRPGTDCCHWLGVRCDDTDGHVTSLNLADRGLESGGLDPAVFDLSSLKYLNLANNYFNLSQLPSRSFERLTKLTHLNLSSTGLFGQVPTDIGSLTKLVSLDLSAGFELRHELVKDGCILEFNPNGNFLTVQNLETLVANLSNLRELHLVHVDLSNSGMQWCNILAKSCPKLQVLRLPSCRLSGPICSSLSALHSLAVIDLQFNHLSGPVPNFIANFSNLTVLQLNRNKFDGWISSAIFKHKKLVTIDLYYNINISGHLPNISMGSRLENLNVGMTNFSGMIPDSLSNLTSLKKLGLGASGFSGELPSSISNLKSLSALEISGLEIVGPIPSWIANLTSLTILKFYNCGLSGSIPSFIRNLRYLQELMLCNCGFSGEIPSHVSNLTQLQIFLVYSNNFVGTVELKLFRELLDLIALDLSDNNLVVLDGEYNSSVTTFPKIVHLSLAHCNMSKFPNFLRHQDEIVWLDLQNNQIHGVIPQWAWKYWNNLSFLMLSNNEFTSVGYAPFLPLQDMEVLDLSSNMFEGPIPIPQGTATALDYSNNMFSSIPSNLSSYLSDVTLFMASVNNLSGQITSSFCGGVTRIKLLDLSYNHFTGSIPSCLIENNDGMQSLYLNENKLHGEFPNNTKEGCSFEALDFSGNQIEGKLPRSLVYCKNLKVFDIGNNQISDSFPCWMTELQSLEVLVLRSNKFFGHVAQSLVDGKTNCAFPSARIIDLSSNSLFGPLPQEQWFNKLKSMMFRDSNTSLVMEYDLPSAGGKYDYSTGITYKGQDTTLAHILTTLVFMDFSDNGFNGSIPAAIGELRLLHGLNVSHNSLTGPIPFQLGQLRQLEALDMSFNELSGEIPQELASLDFLTTLNVSDNKLVGRIPESAHFMTFSNSSFLGNDGLCGPPLSKVCINTTTTTNIVSHHSKKKSVDIVLFLISGLGFGVGFAFAIFVL